MPEEARNKMTSKREVLLNKAFSLSERATPEQMDRMMTFLDLLTHHPGFKGELECDL